LATASKITSKQLPDKKYLSNQLEMDATDKDFAK
jgi:hypothetical protein